MKITTEPLTKITISNFSRLREVIDFNPPYQREGGVWKPETRSALIDSIINGFDIPKVYFETDTNRRKTPSGLYYQYAIIDGKQRLETISGFLNNEVTLPKHFQFFEDTDVQAQGLTLNELKDKYPLLARRFQDFELPIIKVTADSGDLVEEMFQRLNASTSLNAAERRNSLNVPIRDAVNTLAKHPLLEVNSPIKDARYKYRELSAKFLSIEHQTSLLGRLSDTKAQTLYQFFQASRPGKGTITQDQIDGYSVAANAVLDRMAGVFQQDDRLLASIGTVVVYYIAFRDNQFGGAVTREALLDFETQRQLVAKMSDEEQEYGRGAYARLRDYNSLVQSTNDGTALTRRVEILHAFVLGYSSNSHLDYLDTLGDGEMPEVDDSDVY